MKEIQTYQSLLDHIQQKDAISGIAQPPSCGVCKSLNPKVEHLARDNFSKLTMLYVDIEAVPKALTDELRRFKPDPLQSEPI